MIPQLCVSLLLLSSVEKAFSYQCACAKGDVNVRAGPSLHDRVLTSLSDGNCLPYKEYDQHGTDGITWANVDYNGQNAWISKHYVNIGTCTTEKCACSTYNDVHVRTGAGLHSQVVATLSIHQCVTYKNHTQSADGYTWLNVDYHGQDAWIAGTYVHISTCTNGTNTNFSGVHSNIQLHGCPQIISRSDWGARNPSENIGHLPGIPKYVFIHHGATPGCTTKDECMTRVRGYQTYHMESHQWPDIGYSFLVGEDGNVYEGRGWDEIGAHTLNYNSIGLGICIIGDFTDHVPNNTSLNAVKQLIACGVDNHKISTNYILHGHRDVGQTTCPGDKLYELIRVWPHYRAHHN
ncbi:hypothetical protein ACJMK2_039112 [Sinanodonta woodiana]|uniref:SH3b domain-containing protein n=1 Tax=Sinanodonta woodiana TaxID=1069815 RepID=A0ABD3WB58_SINWO